MDNESLDELAGDDKEVESAKRRFADIMLTRDDGVPRSMCWVYVTTANERTG